MDDLRRHYDRYDESGRLFERTGPLELARTQEIIVRLLPPPPAVVVDVGGGPGVYSLWLASKGYEVHLVELVARHVEQARSASEKQQEHPIASFHAGDARELPQGDGMADAVLLFGPLYHLTEESERLLALREAHRVLRSGGVLFAAAISRFASLMDGLSRELINDGKFLPILDRDLREGQHRNPTDNLEYFTTAFFHHPEMLRSEVAKVGFVGAEVLPVEGPGWIARDFEQRWAKPGRREQLLQLVRRVENEPSLLGMSPHLIATATKE